MNSRPFRNQLDRAAVCLTSWLRLVLIRLLTGLGIAGLTACAIGILITLDEGTLDLNGLALLAALLLTGGLLLGLGLDAVDEYRGRGRRFKWTRRLGLPALIAVSITLPGGILLFYPDNWPAWLESAVIIACSLLLVGACFALTRRRRNPDA
ncbi:MAG: hypothetical protein GF399_01770 [Candidatus Coatesbacteria bacterium]|nr:hypothetical protein [Candidatus Coatesbacteria bacterium]